MSLRATRGSWHDADTFEQKYPNPIEPTNKSSSDYDSGTDGIITGCGNELKRIALTIVDSRDVETVIVYFAAVFGMFAINRLPQHYHPLFKSNRFRGVTTDKFFLAIESSDPKYNQSSVKEFLQSIGATHVEVINS